MKKYQDTAILLVRVALAMGFLSAVASRLSFWGEQSSGWGNFLAYAGKVNSFAPPNIVFIIAIISTLLEAVLALLLLIGYRTRLASIGAATLTLLFAIAMTYSFGVKDPLDYSVFAFSATAFLLATMPQYRWSMDEILLKNNNS